VKGCLPWCFLSCGDWNTGLATEESYYFMHPDLIEVLRCPETSQPLRLERLEERNGHIYSGWLISEGNGQRYSIREFIPRFVLERNYADNFGMQWNRFRQTQLDSYSGHPISANRFWQATRWKPEELRGRWALDVGCGAGRFTEVVLQAGAKVIALDYSNAVRVCYENLRHYQNLHVIQGDIYHLPLRRAFFPFVYSLGVLQHTPDVAKAFAALPPLLCQGGRLAVDIYQKTRWTPFLPKHWLRPLTKRLSNVRLLRLLQITVPTLLEISCCFQRVPIMGTVLKKMVPVANYTGIFPLRPEQNLEWALLDTFDWLSPEYDHPQTAATLRRWFQEVKLTDIEVEKAGLLIGRGTKPSG
jgi:SAM-dependent methyltransferase